MEEWNRIAGNKEKRGEGTNGFSDTFTASFRKYNHISTGNIKFNQLYTNCEPQTGIPVPCMWDLAGKFPTKQQGTGTKTSVY